MTSSTTPKKPSPPPLHWLDGATAEIWHATAPDRIVEAYAGNEGQEGWEALTDHLESRRGRPPLAKLFSGGQSAIRWLMPDTLANTETAELIAQLGSSKSFTKPGKRRRWADIAANWLDAASVASASVAHAYECLAWTHALPQLPHCIGESLWWKLANHLVKLAHEVEQLTADRDPLLWQLLSGELPVALAYVLPELQTCHDHSRAAWPTISAGLDTLLDVDGVPVRQRIAIFPALFASWTRSRGLANQMGDDDWQEPDSRRYELALLCLTRLVEIDPPICRACLKFELEKPTRRLMRLLSGRQPVSNKRARDKKLPLPAMHSEESRLAVLRPTWSAKAPRLNVSYEGRSVQLELQLAGEAVLSGEWRLELALDDRPREIAGEWENICWYSDKDVDFLEIEASFGAGLTAQRQILLAREDHVLLFADAILSREPGRIGYRSSLPVCSGIGFHGAEETRDGHLVGQTARALVLPLALPEWRCDPRRGNLEFTSTGISLHQAHEGSAAYAPLLLDLDAGRAKKQCTWRQLTVAEWRQPQASDVAVGFRGQIGDRNWLVYRSLAGEGIRSLLGQQVKAEFLFGRMKPDGDCARLLEIEPT